MGSPRNVKSANCRRKKAFPLKGEGLNFSKNPTCISEADSGALLPPAPSLGLAHGVPELLFKLALEKEQFCALVNRQNVSERKKELVLFLVDLVVHRQHFGNDLIEFRRLRVIPDQAIQTVENLSLLFVQLSSLGLVFVETREEPG